MIKILHGKHTMFETFGFETVEAMVKEAENNKVLTGLIAMNTFDMEHGASQFVAKTQTINMLTGLDLKMPSEYYDYLIKALNRDEFLELANSIAGMLIKDKKEGLI